MGPLRKGKKKEKVSVWFEGLVKNSENFIFSLFHKSSLVAKGYYL